MKAVGPGGEWHVRRRWAPRHLGTETISARFRERFRKVRRRTSAYRDVPDPGCAPDIAEAIVVFVVLIVFVLFLIFVGLPLLVALGELVLVLVLTLGGVLGRVLFRRPWIVDAVGPDGEHRTWAVIGWRASTAARQFIADRITVAGEAPSDDEVAAAVLGR